MENEKDFLQTFVLVVFMLSVIIVLMNSCNKQFIDVNYTYDKAFIKWMDGTSEEVQLKSWRDYRDNDQLQLKTTDGRTILVHSINCILVKSN